MAERHGFQPIILIGKEATYAVGTTDPTIKLFCDFVAVDGDEEVAIPQKTTFAYPLNNENHKGRSAPKVTLSGVLNDNMSFLLTAITDTASTPFIWELTGVAPVNASYAIWQCFPASSSDPGDGVECLGCVLETITFSKSGDYIAFNAVFRAKSIDREADLNALDETAITTPASSATTAYIAPTPFLWHSVTCSLMSASITAMDDFTLTFTNEFPDDDAVWQNSQTKASDVPCFRTGQLSCTTIYDTVHDAKIFDFILGTADIYDHVISFINTNATWAFTMKGQYVEPYDLPDIAKCKYRSTWNVRLCGDADEVPLSIALS